jgi:exosortase
MSDITTRPGWRTSPPLVGRFRAIPWLWPRASAFRRVVLVFALYLAVALIYWPSSKALNLFWAGTINDEFTHGYLILATSLWLIVRDRQRLAAAPLQPVPRAWIMVLLLSAAWLWFWRAAIQDLHLLLVPLILSAALLAVLGWRAMRVLWFPLGFLYFAMPALGDFSPILRALCDKVMGALMWITGVPGFMQGDLIQLPAGTLRIAEGCSGMHFLIVGAALATLYGELSRDSLSRRMIWIALMGGLSLIANWVRIFAIILVGLESQMRSPLIRNHYWLGWIIFVVAFFCFLWIAGRLASTWDRDRRTEANSPQERVPPDGSRISLAHLAGTLVVLSLLPGLSYAMEFHEDAPSSVIISWPSAPAGWLGPLPVAWSEWAPMYVDPSARAFRRYVSPEGQAVEIFTVAYREQRQRGKLLGYWNSLLGADGRLERVAVRTVNSPDGSWRQTTVRDFSGERSLIWSRYRIGKRNFTSGRLSQLWYGIAALAGRPVSSLTALRALCKPDCAAARGRLAVATELRPALHLAEGGRGGPAR